MPIINLKTEKDKKLQDIENRCITFLKENNLNNYVLTITMECIHCNVICTCKEAPIFECPICHYQWEVSERAIGFKEVNKI